MIEASSHLIESAREEQQALSRLSRTSKWLRLNAQPVLYHYFHTGTRDSWGEAEDWGHDSEHTGRVEQFECFLRTILQRPDLAESIRAFAFFGCKDVRTNPVPSNTQLLFRQARNFASFEALSSYDNVSLGWMQELALFVAPFLEQLLIYRPALEGFQHLKHSPLNLPHLKYLVLPGRSGHQEKCYHLQETKDLLNKAENLRALTVVDCDCGSDITLRERFRGDPWDASLKSVRKLSIDGLDPNNLEKVLHSCPNLEDLEYLCDMDKYTVLQEDQLKPVRPSLRRLCYTGTTWELAKGKPQEVIDVVTQFLKWDRTLKADMSLSDFPSLQVLRIEQLLLYGPVFNEDERAQRFEESRETGPEIFMARLPKSIRVLHIGMVLAWPELYRDLKGLSTQLVRFPELVTVAVDPYEPPPARDVKELERLFGKHGVSFSLGRTTQSAFARGMLGSRPGHPEPVEGTNMSFALEDI